MKKFLWSNDGKEITRLLAEMIGQKLPVGIKARGLAVRKTVAKALHHHDQRQYLLLSAIPEATGRGNSEVTFLCKTPGLPLLSFSGSLSYRSEKYFAVEVPREIYKMQMRKAERFLAPQGSFLTFSTPAKQHFSLCRLTDISGCGARIEGATVYPLHKNETIGPCTLSLSEYQALIVHEVSLSSATIAWVDRSRSDGIMAGLRFRSTKSELLKLTGQLDYLTRQSPYRFQPAATAFPAF